MNEKKIDDLLKEMAHDADELQKKIKRVKTEFNLDEFNLDLLDLDNFFQSDATKILNGSNNLINYRDDKLKKDENK